MRVEDGNAAEAKEWDYKGVMCNSAGARNGVDCCHSKRKATELRLAGRSLPGSSGSLAMLEILEAQRVIEEVEAEAREHIPTETIARVCSEFYRVDDFSTDERRFITTIANAALTIPVCTSTWD